VFGRFECKARAILDALLSKCADDGVLNLEDKNILRAPPLSNIGMPVELIRAFRGKPRFENAVHELQEAIYQEPSW
jgi:type I restriction enzyme, R subunit